MRLKRLLPLLPALAVLVAAPAAAQERGPLPGDSLAVVEVVDRFHRALAEGDSASALALLTPDAVVLEGGGVEDVAEYRSHHLPADIEFARAVPRERGPIHATVRGGTAWTVSASAAEGEFRGKPVDSRGAELMVLTRTDEGWRIAAIHWSSRAR